MQKFLNDLIPNVMAKLPDFYAAIGDTLLMVVWAGAISFVIGLGCILPTPNAPGQRGFSRCTASFFLEIRHARQRG